MTLKNPSTEKATKAPRQPKVTVEEAPKLTVEYPTADELRALSTRCNALGNAVKDRRGFMGVAATRAAIDLDYLARIIEADPVKQIGEWTLVIKAALPKTNEKTKRKGKR